MAKARHLATPSGYNVQTSPFGPFPDIEDYDTHKAPPTFNNQRIQGSLESCVSSSPSHCNHEELPWINHAMP